MLYYCHVVTDDFVLIRTFISRASWTRDDDDGNRRISYYRIIIFVAHLVSTSYIILLYNGNRNKNP